MTQLYGKSYHRPRKPVAYRRRQRSYGACKTGYSTYKSYSHKPYQPPMGTYATSGYSGSGGRKYQRSTYMPLSRAFNRSITYAKSVEHYLNIAIMAGHHSIIPITTTPGSQNGYNEVPPGAKITSIQLKGLVSTSIEGEGLKAWMIAEKPAGSIAANHATSATGGGMGSFVEGLDWAPRLKLEDGQRLLGAPLHVYQDFIGWTHPITQTTNVPTSSAHIPLFKIHKVSMSYAQPFMYRVTSTSGRPRGDHNLYLCIQSHQRKETGHQAGNITLRLVLRVTYRTVDP